MDMNHPRIFTRRVMSYITLSFQKSMGYLLSVVISEPHNGATAEIHSFFLSCDNL